MSTATTVAPCPDWCQNSTCRTAPVGEHYTDNIAFPASGGDCLQWLVDRDWTGAHLPLVSLRLSYVPADGDDAPSISLLVNNGKNEVEVHLRAAEANRLLGELQSHVGLIHLQQQPEAVTDEPA